MTAEQIKKERKKSRRRDAGFAYALVAPFILVFLFFSVVPFVGGIIMSLMKYNPYLPETNQFIGFANFTAIFDPNNPISTTFLKSFLTLFAFDFVLTPSIIIIQFLLAYVNNMHPPGYKIFRVILYMPCVVSVSVLGIIFGNMFAGTEQGLINATFGKVIRWMGGIPWESDFKRWFVMFIATIWWQTGGNFIIFSGALQSVPKSLSEACEMDGGGRARKIFTVVLPHMKGTVSLCLFNTIIAYMGIYGQAVMFSEIENAGILVTPMMFLQNFLSNINYAKQTGYICACAVVFGLIQMILGQIERTALADRELRQKHSIACEKFMEFDDYYKTVILPEVSA